MADEETPSPLTDELDDFARSFTADEPETPPTETPPSAEEVKTPAPEEKPKEDVKPPAEEEEEDIFKLDEEKPKEGKSEEDEKDPEKPTSKDDWARLRESRDKHKATAAERESLLRERESELAELRVKAAEAAELREKLKVFDEQEKELALARIESTVEFKENIEKPLIAIRGEAEALAKENDSDFDPIREMLLEPDRTQQRIKLKELTAGWDEVDRSELKKMADDARVLLDKQDAMRANAHATAKEQKELQAQREQEARENARKEFAKVTGDVVKALREKMPFVPLAEGETEDDRFTALQEKVNRVDFDAQSPRAKALAAASALAMPTAIKTIAAKDAEIADLKAALAKATSGKPSITPKFEGADAEKEKDFFEEFGITDRSKMFGAV